LKLNHNILESSALLSEHLSIGFFDGVHLGHQRILFPEELKSKKVSHGVLTFWPHPKASLSDSGSPELLTSFEEKLELLASLGILECSVIRFNREFSQQTHLQFLEILSNRFPNIQSLSVGSNFRFGHQRTGNIEDLAHWAKQQKIDFYCPPLFQISGKTISSSLIRSLIVDGDFERAQSYLGRPYTITAKVIQGQQRGRTIGFPTANLDITGLQLPPSGVYAVNATIVNQNYHAVMNIGTNPTFNSQDNVSEQKVEVHIIEFDQSIYGQVLKIEPIHFIRAEKKFTSVSELRGQIRLDLDKAKLFFKGIRGS